MGLDQSDGWQDNDPLPLGDEVSMGVISRPESENNRTNFTQGNLLKGIDNKTIRRMHSLFTYSVVSIKHTGGNKRTGWAEFFHLLHEKRVQGGAKIFLLHEKLDQGGAKTSK